jgi:uncharacterized membrane protein YuzA (DUF378 family)
MFIRATQILACVLLVLGGLNYAFLGSLKTNIIERLIGKSIITRILYLLIGASALFLAFHQDTYIPFFGETIFPSIVIQEQTPAGATRTVKVKIRPRTKVIYWASEPGDNLNKKSFDIAYGKYENAGVTTSDNNGVALLKVREPQSYNILFKTLVPHIHYRMIKESGFLDSVHTIYL